VSLTSREAEADWAKLTVSARWAQALAKTVDPRDLEAMIKTQLALAADPTRGQTAVQAGRLVLAMVTTATADEDDEVDPNAELERMTPEQRRRPESHDPEGSRGGGLDHGGRRISPSRNAPSTQT
jgi:hypothetical protein